MIKNYCQVLNLNVALSVTWYQIFFEIMLSNNTLIPFVSFSRSFQLQMFKSKSKINHWILVYFLLLDLENKVEGWQRKVKTLKNSIKRKDVIIKKWPEK